MWIFFRADAFVSKSFNSCQSFKVPPLTSELQLSCCCCLIKNSFESFYSLEKEPEMGKLSLWYRTTLLRKGLAANKGEKFAANRYFALLCAARVLTRGFEFSFHLNALLQWSPKGGRQSTEVAFLASHPEVPGSNLLTAGKFKPSKKLFYRWCIMSWMGSTTNTYRCCDLLSRKT